MSAATGMPAWADRPPSQRYDPDTSHGVPCPGCGGDSRVIDSRPRDKSIRRRRVCILCKTRFTTYEIATDDDPAEGLKLLRKQADELRSLADRIEQMSAERPAEAAE